MWKCPSALVPSPQADPRRMCSLFLTNHLTDPQFGRALLSRSYLALISLLSRSHLAHILLTSRSAGFYRLISAGEFVSFMSKGAKAKERIEAKVRVDALRESEARRAAMHAAMHSSPNNLYDRGLQRQQEVRAHA